MLQLKDTKASTIDNAIVNNCLVTTSVSNSECINTVSPTFVTCTGSFNFSQDTTAATSSIGTGNVVPTFNPDGTIDATWYAANLAGNGWNSTDPVAWAVGISLELTITIGTLDSSIVIYQPTVAKDTPLTISPITVESTTVTYAPTINKDKIITIDTLNNVSIEYTPVVLKDKQVTIPSLANVSLVYSPVVLKGKEIYLDTFNNTSITYAPSVLSSKYVTLDTIVNEEVIYNVSIVSDKLISLSTTYNESTLYAPEVIGGYRPLPTVTLYQAEGYGVHIRSAQHMNTVIQELAKRIEILEGH